MTKLEITIAELPSGELSVHIEAEGKAARPLETALEKRLVRAIRAEMVGCSSRYAEVLKVVPR